MRAEEAQGKPGPGWLRVSHRPPLTPRRSLVRSFDRCVFVRALRHVFVRGVHLGVVRGLHPGVGREFRPRFDRVSGPGFVREFGPGVHPGLVRGRAPGWCGGGPRASAPTPPGICQQIRS